LRASRDLVQAALGLGCTDASTKPGLVDLATGAEATQQVLVLEQPPRYASSAQPIPFFDQPRRQQIDLARRILADFLSWGEEGPAFALRLAAAWILREEIPPYQARGDTAQRRAFQGPFVVEEPMELPGVDPVVRPDPQPDLGAALQDRDHLHRYFTPRTSLTADSLSAGTFTARSRSCSLTAGLPGGGVGTQPVIARLSAAGIFAADRAWNLGAHEVPK
jgi:hypothetical protein